MKILFQVPKGNVEDDQSMPIPHLYASKHDNVTSSIQDTVCLELGKCNKTAASYGDSIYQNLFQTLRSAAQKVYDCCCALTCFRSHLKQKQPAYHVIHITQYFCK